MPASALCSLLCNITTLIVRVVQIEQELQLLSGAVPSNPGSSPLPAAHFATLLSWPGLSP